MKKNSTPKKSTYPAQDLREEWKETAADEIITLQEDLDECIDGLDLSEDTKKMIEKAVDKFKERLNDAIGLFEVTPKIAADETYFTENFLDAIYFEEGIVIGESEINRMVDIVTSNRTGKGGIFFQVENLAQEMRIEQFLEELKENPCQLKLIA